jgi:motility quorum-sensing regulator/GCU-specific mRNA interferase toxin
MAKRNPHYDILAIQTAVRLRGADAFTASALIGAQAMGLEIAEVIDVVCSSAVRISIRA